MRRRSDRSTAQGPIRAGQARASGAHEVTPKHEQISPTHSEPNEFSHDAVIAYSEVQIQAVSISGDSDPSYPISQAFLDLSWGGFYLLEKPPNKVQNAARYAPR